MGCDCRAAALFPPAAGWLLAARATLPAAARAAGIWTTGCTCSAAPSSWARCFSAASSAAAHSAPTEVGGAERDRAEFRPR
eukprot:9050706-Alexandrium_andersonii.AAC.1